MSANKDRKEVDKAIRHLMDYVQKSEHWSPVFNGMIDSFCRPVAMELDEPLELIVSELFDGPSGHLAYGYLFEEFVNTKWEDEDSTALEAFIKQRGWREGPAGKRYLRTMAQSELQLLEITLVEPGGWIDVRPFGTDDKPIRVLEKAASQDLQPWHCLAARITRDLKVFRFGGGMLPLIADDAQFIHELVQNVATDLAREYLDRPDDERDGEVIASEFALDVEQEKRTRLIETAFECFALQVLNPSPPVTPQMYNTDNERIVMTKYRFPVSADATELSDRLAAHRSFADEANGNLSWLSADESTTLLGQISVNESELILQTNSVERGKRGVELIESLLGNLVGPAMGVHENIEDLVCQAAEGEGLASAGIDNPELQAHMQAYLTEQYRKTLDEPVPMLDNRSPRECATDPDPESQKMVVDWLKHLEQMSAQNAPMPFDHTWMWEELGLIAHKPPPGK